MSVRNIAFEPILSGGGEGGGGGECQRENLWTVGGGGGGEGMVGGETGRDGYKCREREGERESWRAGQSGLEI